MPKLRIVPGSQRHVIQAFLKVDLEWTSILLYESKGAAMIGLRRLQRLEPAPKHQLRVKKWQAEEIMFPAHGAIARHALLDNFMHAAA